jgi:iron complex transport system permease protein
MFSASKENLAEVPGSRKGAAQGSTRQAGLAWRLGFSALLLVALMALALLMGRYPSTGFLSFSGLWDDPLALKVILLIRLPRLILAALTGAVLGAAGCVFQLVFSNALVDAGFLGVS